MIMKLSEKVALINGSTSGIELETATLFQSGGARVIVTGANQAGLDAASRELGSDAIALRVDLYCGFTGALGVTRDYPST
jgi:NAD(P)-dependent dehydrogenase (short-subunit alcohol dehydrogenase family)